MINTYWVMVTGTRGDYSYTYFPSIKREGTHDDIQPPRPDFTKPITPVDGGQLQLPTGAGESQLTIVQVTNDTAPPLINGKALAPELVLFGVVAKTLDGTSRLSPYYAANLGATAVEVAPNSSRGTSLVFAHLSGGLVTQLYCSPDPVAINPGSW